MSTRKATMSILLLALVAAAAAILAAVVALLLRWFGIAPAEPEQRTRGIELLAERIRERLVQRR
jgi:TRAP-type C4-dicarboxylate transport system substrate-binding protein